MKTNQTTFTIESGFEAPEIRYLRSRYPFRQMKIGDSFFVPELQAHKVRTAASYFHCRNREFSFVTRQEKGGVRVWRVKPHNGTS